MGVGRSERELDVVVDGVERRESEWVGVGRSRSEKVGVGRNGLQWAGVEGMEKSRLKCHTECKGVAWSGGEWDGVSRRGSE